MAWISLSISFEASLLWYAVSIHYPNSKMAFSPLPVPGDHSEAWLFKEVNHCRAHPIENVIL